LILLLLLLFVCYNKAQHKRLLGHHPTKVQQNNVCNTDLVQGYTRTSGISESSAQARTTLLPSSILLTLLIHPSSEP